MERRRGWRGKEREGRKRRGKGMSYPQRYLGFEKRGFPGGQWLRLQAFTSEGQGSIPGRELRSPQGKQHGQIKEFGKRREGVTYCPKTHYHPSGGIYLE